MKITTFISGQYVTRQNTNFNSIDQYVKHFVIDVSLYYFSVKKSIKSSN